MVPRAVCYRNTDCPQLAEAVGQEIVREELTGACVRLLKDNEAEVRTAAASQIPGKS
jgi:serine/threonine-protein phosphatase 2A regulatory subunit A